MCSERGLESGDLIWWIKVNSFFLQKIVDFLNDFDFFGSSLESLTVCREQESVQHIGEHQQKHRERSQASVQAEEQLHGPNRYPRVHGTSLESFKKSKHVQRLK